MWGGDTAHGQLCCVREAPTKQPAAGGNNIREWKRSDGRAQKSRGPTYQREWKGGVQKRVFSPVLTRA